MDKYMLSLVRDKSTNIETTNITSDTNKRGLEPTLSAALPQTKELTVEVRRKREVAKAYSEGDIPKYEAKGAINVKAMVPPIPLRNAMVQSPLIVAREGVLT
ncbi:hypothetical protein IPA_06900 [Ignicoccus pacificus DSM 13166]|uniref:Uncharacterized protein n=1 Tax=Ignicoccus pacificus DSM 13166 TaxID=940294 RepID=A0A977PL46_9CREN|nr:hypothetical protein IPA_06900 [Ignicoccus pacificus DSM 13166]